MASLASYTAAYWYVCSVCWPPMRFLSTVYRWLQLIHHRNFLLVWSPAVVLVHAYIYWAENCWQTRNTPSLFHMDMKRSICSSGRDNERRLHWFYDTQSDMTHVTRHKQLQGICEELEFGIWLGQHGYLPSNQWSYLSTFMLRYPNQILYIELAIWKGSTRWIWQPVVMKCVYWISLKQRVWSSFLNFHLWPRFVFREGKFPGFHLVTGLRDHHLFGGWATTSGLISQLDCG